jgi:hypothetical protein
VLQQTRPPWTVVAVTLVALFVAGCSGSSASSAARGKAASTVSSAGTQESAKQRYLDRVNALCDALLPRVIRVTHGGSLDVPARQYLRDWPAHRRVLAAFDASLADVPVPAAAASAARALARYVRFADTLDAARLEAARAGEPAWQREVVAENGVESDPRVTARDEAGFAPSCDAR